MPLVNDTAYTVEDIYNEVANNLYDNGLKFFSSQNVLDSIQDQYNKVVALINPIEKSILVNQLASPYYYVPDSITDFMYLAGIYNTNNNQWLRGFPFRQMRRGSEVFRRTGSPRFYDILDFRRVLCWPFLSSVSTEQMLWFYKAFPAELGLSDTPVLPLSVGGMLLERMATADLLEQGREFGKAVTWWELVFKPQGQDQISIFDQADKEVKAIARMDRESVLEPYRWINHGNA